ncbi:MAG: ATP-binding protein [Salinisphaera sp.]|nr:ATP-binding protein [Salinisphaera sp.]
MIEFFGLAASGKSTMAQLLKAALGVSNELPYGATVGKDASATYEFVSKRLWASLGESLSNPMDAIRLWQLVLRFRPRASRALRLVANHHYVRKSATRGGNGGFIIQDQGIAQILWSSLYHGRKDPGMDLLQRYLDHGYGDLGNLRTRIVVLDCPEAVIFERLAARKYGRSAFEPVGPATMAVFARARWAYHRSLEALEYFVTGRSDMAIIRMDGCADPHQAANELGQKIQKGSLA